ncbi:hypothetical protein [Streptomyces sp. NPDC051001]|uniref:hypothetical protein n=1 Tax=Streptomyces sp. NPDC051001 TaxID=3155795 RepID=UPI00343555C5
MRKYCAQLLAIGLAVPLLTLGTPAATTIASVSIDAGRTLATFPETGVAMNAAVYDGNMNHPAILRARRVEGLSGVRRLGAGPATRGSGRP